MKVIISKQRFLKYLSYTDTISSSKTTVPVLSNVLLDADDVGLSLNSSNLETGIKIDNIGEIKESGALAVNGKKLLSIVRELPDDDIELTTDEYNRVTIMSTSTSINAKFVIAGIAKEDFPGIRTEPEGEYVEIKADEFKKMIKKVIFSISNDENKYSLTGIFMEKADGRVNLVATDGKRLSLITRGLDELEVADEMLLIPHDGVIIPRIVLMEIVKYSFEDNIIKMGFSKNQIFFSYDNVYLTSNLIEGKFPEYKKIIPEQRENHFIADRELFFNAIKRVSVLVDESVKQIKISVLKNKLLISSKDPALGGAVEDIPVEYEGEDIDIALNYLYILDCLKEIEADRIKIDFENQERVLTVKGENEKNYLNLIMPMKINL
jgi:DNA polymerase-3 subunit beta